MIRLFNREVVGGILWLLIGAGICFGSLRLSLGSLSNPGPGLFPFITGFILLVLSVILVANEVGKQSEDEKERVAPHDSIGRLRAGMVCIALVAYALSMDYLGFVIASTLFLAFLLGVIVSARWYVVLGGSGFASGVIYTVFKIWLDSPLPSGLLGT